MYVLKPFKSHLQSPWGYLQILRILAAISSLQLQRTTSRFWLHGRVDQHDAMDTWFDFQQWRHGAPKNIDIELKSALGGWPYNILYIYIHITRISQYWKTNSKSTWKTNTVMHEKSHYSKDIWTTTRSSFSSKSLVSSLGKFGTCPWKTASRVWIQQLRNSAHLSDLYV